MDKKIKVVIVVLVVLAVLFFSGMAGHLVPKEKGSADTYKPGGWETSLGKWMSPPSLDVKNLLTLTKDKDNDKDKDKCQYTTDKNEDYEDYEVILLNKTKDTCEIFIASFKDEKYKKGKLTLIKEGTEIPDVTVQYLPDGKSKDDEDYKAVSFKDKPVKLEKSFVVLEDGGTLTVKCVSCFEVQERTIRVKFE